MVNSFKRNICKNKNIADIAQLVEHQLPKLKVAGSSPVIRFLTNKGGSYEKNKRRKPNI